MGGEGEGKELHPCPKSRDRHLAGPLQQRDPPPRLLILSCSTQGPRLMAPGGQNKHFQHCRPEVFEHLQCVHMFVCVCCVCVHLCALQRP